MARVQLAVRPVRGIAAYVSRMGRAGEKNDATDEGHPRVGIGGLAIRKSGRDESRPYSGDAR